MKKYILLIIIALSLGFNALTQDQNNPEITTDELYEHVDHLASDELEGRLPGTSGGMKAAEYIKEQLKIAGLELLGEDGFQYFDVVTDVKVGKKNSFKVTNTMSAMMSPLFVGEVEKDFMPFSFTENASVNGSIAFVGYGFEIDRDSIQWNDYENIDVKGKWVMMFRSEPLLDKDQSPYMFDAAERDKVLTARDHNAAGVIFVSPEALSKEDKLVSPYFDKTKSGAGLPVIHITREAANKILETKGQKIEDLEASFKEELKPNSFETPCTLEATTEMEQVKVKARNVVAWMEGSDPILKDEYIIIGAHFDHLGMGGHGSGSREPDVQAVHNGADDNASGTAGIIEIAEKLQANRNNIKRSVLIIAFDAEEMGLLGSKYYTSNTLTSLGGARAMLNFDMIGRLNKDTKTIMIGGSGTSKQSEDLLRGMEKASGLTFKLSPEGFGPSDHAAFYAEDIPVFFISSGAHGDYHTPKDDIGELDFAGQKMICDFSYDLIEVLANRCESLSFQEAGPKARASSRMRLKVTLGIMPDFTSQENNGLGVGGVTPGRPADKAGMLKGDRIVAMEGKEVTNIYDYMNRLKKLEPGQIITVDVIRDGKKEVLIVNL